MFVLWNTNTDRTDVNKQNTHTPNTQRKIVFAELNFAVAFLLIRKTWDDVFAGKGGEGGILRNGGGDPSNEGGWFWNWVLILLYGLCGMCILDFSKVLLSEIHYDWIKNKSISNSGLLFTVADSLIKLKPDEIKAEDVNDDFSNDKEMLDFSNYSAESIY